MILKAFWVSFGGFLFHIQINQSKSILLMYFVLFLIHLKLHFLQTDMTQFIGAPVELKMNAFLPEKTKEDKDKNEAKLVTLALKDVDTEIDKFVQANTRELAKDKWLCPLSGKKFKGKSKTVMWTSSSFSWFIFVGPDFVRKHIFNKHAEKIEEVKKEVEFFNNYLKDPKRPMLAESPQPKREETPTYNHQ